MRIGINITYGVMDKPTGVGNYILNLINSLLKIDTKNNYLMYYRYSKVKKNNIKNFNVPNKFFEPRLGFLNVFDNIDIFHDPSFKYVKIPGAKTVITVHDVVVALENENFSSKHFKKYNLPKLKKAIKKADKIIAVSNFSKREIIKYFNTDEKKIDVIYSGVDTEKFQKKQKTNTIKLPEKYFLFVGNIEFRKNIINLVKAFINFQKKHKNYYLIIIGKNGYGGNEIRKFIENQNNAHIIQMNYVKNNNLGIYYRNSIAFLYPSFYEGFGLPILEAMASGTIVITSDNNATVEAGGKAAVYVNPFKIEDIEEKINYVSNLTYHQRKKIISTGFEHVKRFTWEKTALNTIKIYNSLIK